MRIRKQHVRQSNPNLTIGRAMRTFLICTILLIIGFVDSSADWEKCSNLPDNSQSLSYFMKIYDDVVYIGTVTGLHASKDKGDSWNLTGFKMRDVYDMEFVDDKFIAVTELGIFTSTDKGQKWTGGMGGITDTLAQPCKNIYKCENFILVTKKERTSKMKFENYLYLSNNFGANWVEIGEELRNVHILDFYVHDCNIYAVSSLIVYISSDEGKTWNIFLEPFTEYDSFNKIEINNNCISIFDAYDNIYISLDKGVTWETREILYGSSPNKISIKDSIILFTTYFDGMFFSTNRGDNWIGPVKINNSLRFHNNCISKEYVYVIVTWDNIYRIKTSNIGVLASVPSDENKRNFSIHPNPASEYIEISIAINPTVNRRVDEGSDIRIFNTLGECIINESIHPMTPSHRMNIEHLPQDVYYVRIGNQTQMFVKI